MSTPRGKIGRLPAAVRIPVNEMIHDNRTAEEIISYLEQHAAAGVTPQNVSAWKANGYQEWLRRQERLEAMAQRREFAKDLIEAARADGDSGLALESDTASALAVDSLMDVLEEFDPSTLKARIAERPELILEVSNSLSRIRARDQAGLALREKLEAARALAARTAADAAASGNADLKRIAEEMDRVLGG